MTTLLYGEERPEVETKLPSIAPPSPDVPVAKSPVAPYPPSPSFADDVTPATAKNERTVTKRMARRAGPATPIPWARPSFAALPSMVLAVAAAASVWMGLALVAVVLAYATALPLLSELLLGALAAGFLSAGIAYVTEARPELA